MYRRLQRHGLHDLRYDTVPPFTTLPAPKDPMPVTGGSATPGTATTTPPAGTSDPLAFLSGSIFGIPIKWLLIGGAAFFLLKR